MILMKNTSSMYSQGLAQVRMFVEDLIGGERKLRRCKLQKIFLTNKIYTLNEYKVFGS